MNSKLDEKLIKNILDEINRLNQQLNDLIIYKDELSQEEIEQIKNETLDQLINNKRILEKMRQGEISANSELEQAQMKLNAMISQNYNMKDLLNTYLSGESSFLRTKLNEVIKSFEMKKIKIEEYESNVSQILEVLSKSTSLNDEEKKLYESLKNKVMNKYEKDQGINQSKIEKSIMK